MAEVIAALGVVASVAQLADYGFKLSVKLFTFSKAVASADTSIKDISNDVSLTSTVLKELCQILQADESHVVSENAIEATSQTVKECLSIFEQLNEALDKSLTNLGVVESKGKVKRGKVALEKLKWPFKQNKMELLRSNLDRLKASLTLMLQVLSYARDISTRKAAESSLVYQKHLIESLARSEQETKRRYFALQKAIEGQKTEPVLNAFINTSVHVTETRDMSIMSQPTEAKSPTTPVAHHRTIVGELLLCFQLLNDVLGYHLAISNLSKLSSMGYDQLRVTLEKVHVKELNKLREEFGDAPTHIKAEAAKNLETRLKKLAKVGFLKERKYERTSGRDTGSDLVEMEKKNSQELKMLEENFQLAMKAKDEGFVEALKQQEKRIEEKISQQNERAQEMKSEEEIMIPQGKPMRLNETDRRAGLQAEIDSTTRIMRDNIGKVAQRGERLDSLQNEADNLSVSAQAFRRGANRIRADQSLWARALRGVTQGVGAVGELGSEGYKAVQGFSGSVYEAATALLETREDDLDLPGSVGSTSPIGLTPQSDNEAHGSSYKRRISFDDDDVGSDAEAAAGLEAMRLAEELDAIVGSQAAMGKALDADIREHGSLVEDSHDDYDEGMDQCSVGGGYETHMSYGADERKEESEDENIVDDLLSQWTNLPPHQDTRGDKEATGI